METLSVKIKSKRNEHFNNLENYVDEPCVHAICPECQAKHIDNAKKREELLQKVGEYDEILKSEIIIK